MTDLSQTLNEAQEKAVLHDTGPALVLAGAGSGKTRVLTTRAAFLIQEEKTNPEEILLVTFTNKAAQEMNQRLQQLTGYNLPYSGTFHSICARILRQYGHLNGLSRNYVIYDSNDQRTLIKQILKDRGYSVRKKKPRKLLGTISKVKNEILSPQDYKNFAKGEYQEFAAKIYAEYQNRLNKQNAVDFDDLLIKVVELFQTQKKITSKLQDQFHHVLIDEYQDTNKAQYLLTTYLAKPQKNIYVVGDFSQSIYAWRGADYKNLFYLEKDYPDIKKYKLERNYRSTQTILSAATDIISQNKSHPILKLWTDEDTQDHNKIEVYQTDSNYQEAEKVTQIIDQLLEQGYEYHNMAILYRTNAQSRSFEEAFVKKGLPYQIIGGFKFYERKEIKDVLAYLKIIINPLDSVSRERALKLGKRRFKKFEKWLKKQKNITEEKPYKVLNGILTATDYLSKYDEDVEEEAGRIENVKELLNTANNFDSILTYLENIALVQDDTLIDLPDEKKTNTVTLMSLHAAKGLEFPIVFMVGMEEGLLPHSRSMYDNDQIEEERRLCYVGITRAKEKLYFTYCNKRWQYGSPTHTTRSRFLDHINSKLLTEYQTVGSHQGKKNQNFHSNQNQTNNGYHHKKRYYYNSRQKKTKNSNNKKKPKRRLVIDEDSIDALLKDEMDIKTFLDK